jgi:hypothetical protein
MTLSHVSPAIYNGFRKELLELAKTGECVERHSAFLKKSPQALIEDLALPVEPVEVSGDNIRKQVWKSKVTQLLLVLSQAVEGVIRYSGHRFRHGDHELMVDKPDVTAESSPPPFGLRASPTCSIPSGLMPHYLKEESAVQVPVR